MKKIIVFLVFESFSRAIMAQASMEPIDDKAALGVWQGYYEQQGENQPLKIEFKEENGALECYVDMPERGLKSAKFEISVCSSKEFHLKRMGVDNTPITFVGKPDGDKMTGRYKIGDTCGPGAPLLFRVVKAKGL